MVSLERRLLAGQDNTPQPENVGPVRVGVTLWGWGHAAGSRAGVTDPKMQWQELCQSRIHRSPYERGK